MSHLRIARVCNCTLAAWVIFGDAIFRCERPAPYRSPTRDLETARLHITAQNIVHYVADGGRAYKQTRRLDS